MAKQETINKKEAPLSPRKKNSGVKLEISELIFKIIAYLFCAVFAIMCIYPFVYAISAAVSSKDAFEYGKIVLLPVVGNNAEGYQMGVTWEAFKAVAADAKFWITYSNTLFVTFYGTIWSLGISILGGYALSKKRLPFRSGLNFYLLFTMWFSAGLLPQFTNYQNTQEVFNTIGISDPRWMVVITMGMNAFNVILLRNAFESVPKEIEEAAIVDGATEFSLLWNVYVPMSKSSIATVGLFYGISRWNGFFWASLFTPEAIDGQPLQVYIRDTRKEILNPEAGNSNNIESSETFIFAMLVCAIIPIIIIYPYIQKYFATGVNVGGVKE